MERVLERVAAEYQALLQGRQRLRDTPMEFRARVVALTADFGKADIADTIGLNRSTLTRWCKEVELQSAPLPEVTVTRIGAATRGDGEATGIEIFSARGDTVRVPFQGDTLERVLAFVLGRGA